MALPVVSVLVPAYQAAATVRRALVSLCCQTMTDWEAIVVDDGSTDGTWECCQLVEDSRIRAIRLTRNLGRGGARQVALNHARGTYICMLDADDWYYPWKLERQLEAIEGSRAGILVTSAMASVGVENNLTGIWKNEDVQGTELLGPVRSLNEMRLFNATCMIRGEAARGFSFDKRLRRAEELHFLARVLKGRRYLTSDEVLYAYCDELSLSRTGPIPRYLWSAWASLKLAQHFPLSGPALAVRKTLQIAFALVTRQRSIGTRLDPCPASSLERDAFSQARDRLMREMADE